MTNGEKFKATFPDVEVRETEKGFVILKLKVKDPGGNRTYCDTITVWNSIWNAEYKEPSPVPIRGYVCDPKKNKECAKTACYEKGGLCCLTLNPEYAREGAPSPAIRIEQTVRRNR